jgi:hypothetical protein
MLVCFFISAKEFLQFYVKINMITVSHLFSSVLNSSHYSVSPQNVETFLVSNTYKNKDRVIFCSDTLE